MPDRIFNMNRSLSIVIALFFVQFLFSQKSKLEQIQEKRNQVASDTVIGSRNSTSNKGLKNDKAKIDLYKIISVDNDSIYVDTTLSIQKDYKFNYLRKDNFNLISFSNIGQTYNTLSYNFDSFNTIPMFGARAKHFNYMEIDDINYYHVPTPLTELLFKTAFEQGQLLDAFFTVNTSERFNFSIAYKGLRSLGNYQNILTSTGNFRFTTNYKSKNKRYIARAHVVMQDIFNQENGGIKDDDISNFESGNEEFIDRSVFDPNFEDAENILVGKRFHLEQEYNIVKSNDSINNNHLSLGNVISFEDKYYQFNQNSQNSYFGEAFQSKSLYDKVTLEDFRTKLFVKYRNNILGTIKLNVDYNNYNYGYDDLVFIESTSIINRLKGDVFSLGGSYNNKIGKLNLAGDFLVNISGNLNGNFLNALVSYQLSDDLSLAGKINLNSKAANYNYLLYHSDYINYNWDNSNSFKNINTKQLVFNLSSKKLVNLYVDFNNIKNYTYFVKDQITNSVKPKQSNNQIDYFRLKVNKEIRLGNFGLDNTILYQNVLKGNYVLNVPEIVTRNTLYYSNHLFKKALYLQTGITFNYFSKYYMNGYDPLLSEFYVQNNTELGNFPRMDFFINAKIRQTRIFLKAEHFNSAFTGYNYYSAPNYPYRDFTIRFGLVWNFFL